MKYAFIALIAIYLVVYGCSPDSSEKATDSHDTTAPVTLEKPHEAEMVAVPAQDEHQQATEAAEQAEVVAVEPAEAAQTVVKEQQETPVAGQQVIVETQPAGEEPDLEAAILKLAETTSDMIQATNQLIEATNRAISAVREKQ